MVTAISIPFVYTLWSLLIQFPVKNGRADLNQQTATIVYDTKDVVVSFVQTDGERLFFGGYRSPRYNKGVVWALDIDTKQIVWKQEVKDGWGWYIATPPLMNKENFIVSTRTTLYGIDKALGDIKWKIENNWFGSGELLTPVLIDGKLIYGVANEYFGGDKDLSDRTIAIADPTSGKTVKTIVMPGRLGAIPVIHENYLFVKDYQRYKRDAAGKLQWIGELRLNCVDINTGEIVWTYNGNGYPDESQPSFYNGLIFDVFANRLYAIEEQSGVLKWQSLELEDAAINPQVIKEAGIIVLEIPSSEKVIFLDLETGDIQDNELLNALSSPVFVGEEAIYGTTNALVKVNIITGDVIWSIPVDSKYQVFQDD